MRADWAWKPGLHKAFVDGVKRVLAAHGQRTAYRPFGHGLAFLDKALKLLATKILTAIEKEVSLPLRGQNLKFAAYQAFQDWAFLRSCEVTIGPGSTFEGCKLTRNNRRFSMKIDGW